jgi:acetolactate synthase-1/2/3 large subunit
MVGPGATYAQMITGEFIASRGAVPVETSEVPSTSMF